MEPTRTLLSVLVPFALAAGLLAQLPTFQAASNNAPGARFGACLSPLSGNSLLLFGGDSGSGRLGDTWRYDIATNTWTQILGPGPSPRRWAAMAQHGATGALVLFGGQGATGDLGDTWLFLSNQWVPVVGANPPARSNHAMAYDSFRQRTVMFGGLNNVDTWEWTGTGWAQRTLTAAPPARTFAGMAFDERRGVMMLGGGSLTGGAYTNQVWELGFSAWVQSAISLPVARAGATFAYDNSRGRFVMHGGLQQGSGGISATGALYEWDGTSLAWTQRALASAIPARYGSQLVYRSGTGVWLFGGSGFGPTYGDLQRYFIQNGASYTQSGPGCGAPALVANSDEAPWLGDQFVRTAQFSTPKLVLHEIGFASQDLDLGFVGMPGCRLGSTADVMGSLLASGAQQFLLNVPNTPSLNGVDLYEQLAVFTPGINPLGIEMSPTMRIHLSSK